MKRLSLMAGLLAASLLAGCQWMPPRDDGPSVATSDCLSDVPSLLPSDCRLAAWVDFGLAAQRGDTEWREQMLARLDGETTQHRLTRAVVLSWADESRWERASDLFKADLSAAPSELQPLLRQWLNGLEARRALAAELDESKASRIRLSRERNSLAEKLDALTAIEESINSRQQEP